MYELIIKCAVSTKKKKKKLYGAADTFRLVIDRFYLWVPRLEPKDALMSKFISDYQKPTKWTYLREMDLPSRNVPTFRFDK